MCVCICAFSTQPSRLDVTCRTVVTNLLAGPLPPTVGDGSDGALVRSGETSACVGGFFINHFLLCANSPQRKSLIPLGFVIGVPADITKERRVMQSKTLACPMIAAGSLKEGARSSGENNRRLAFLNATVVYIYMYTYTQPHDGPVVLQCARGTCGRRCGGSLKTLAAAKTKI